MLAMSSPRVYLYGLFFLLAVQIQAFEFDLPQVIPTGWPVTIGYRHKLDGSDETTWLMNITNVDGSNPEILNDGEIFTSTGFRGTIQIIVEREGPFRLKAVNPDFLRQGYATSPPGYAIDFENDGDGDGTGTGGGTGSGTGGSDDDDDDTGTGSGSGTDPDDDDDNDSTTVPFAASTSTRPRATNTPRPAGAAKSTTNYGLIAGCIAAGVAVLLMILVALFCLRRARERKKPGRPLTFYRDRMIRAPSPPPGQPAPAAPGIHISDPLSTVQNPHDYRHATYAGIPDYSHPYPYGQQPRSASTAIGPPVMREFILRSPRAPASPSQGQPALKEFILRSPRPRESLAYSKP